MSYGANVAAVTWFVREVLPRVVENDPSASLQIVGDSPAAAVRALASERVQVLGRVPEVGPYYSAAQVSIVPVTTATGVQMKLIESLRMGVPTVVTPLVAEQAGVDDGAEVVVAEDAHQWSAAIVKLLRDRAFAADVASRGAVWAEANYSTAAIRHSLLAALSPLLGTGSESATGGVDPIDDRVDHR
jgi:polysaccharide biosynthesis protein PslH